MQRNEGEVECSGNWLRFTFTCGMTVLDRGLSLNFGAKDAFEGGIEVQLLLGGATSIRLTSTNRQSKLSDVHFIGLCGIRRRINETGSARGSIAGSESAGQRKAHSLRCLTTASSTSRWTFGNLPRARRRSSTTVPSLAFAPTDRK